MKRRVVKKAYLRHMAAAVLCMCLLLLSSTAALALEMPLSLPDGMGAAGNEASPSNETALPYTMPESFKKQQDQIPEVRMGSVLCDTKLFALPEEGAQAVAEVSIGQELAVYAVRVNDSFNAVMTEDGQMAYIAADELSLTAPTRDDRPQIHLTDGGGNGYPGELYNDPVYLRLIAEAKQYIGMPYVWGGSTPDTSFDCSGYVCWVLNNSGVFSIERTNAQGLFDACDPLDSADARPGDLIFFQGTYDANWPVTHVAIYVGNGYMLHCGKPIGYSRIDTPYWQEHFYAFGRLPV